MLTENEIKAIEKEAEEKYPTSKINWTNKPQKDAYVLAITQERIKANKAFQEIINDEPTGGFDNGYHKLKNIARKYLDEYNKTQP